MRHGKADIPEPLDLNKATWAESLTALDTSPKRPPADAPADAPPPAVTPKRAPKRLLTALLALCLLSAVLVVFMLAAGRVLAALGRCRSRDSRLLART